MSTTKWRIFISSSHGTTEDALARDHLAREMERGWGVTPVLYSRADFPVAYDANVRENCLRTLDGCQCVILLINSIYGTMVPEIGCSYTEDEYRHAKSVRIPVITLVSERVKKDAFTYRSLDEKERERFLADCSDIYDNPARLFSWVLDIADAADNDRKSTIFFPYKDGAPEEIAGIALDRLRGLSRYFIEEYLVRAQSRYVSECLTSDIFSLGADNDGIGVTYTSAKPEEYTGDLVSAVVSHMRSGEGSRVLIEGDAGSGKSTALKKAYLAALHARTADPDGGSTAPIPILFSLSGRGADYALSENLLHDLWDELLPNGMTYPLFLNTNGLRFDYYLDALDEACIGMSAAQTDTLVREILSVRHAHSILLTTRRSVVKVLELYGLISAFGYRYCLLGWDREQIRRFVCAHTAPAEAGLACTAIRRFVSADSPIGKTDRTSHDSTPLTADFSPIPPLAPLIVKLALWNIRNEGITAFTDRFSHFSAGLLLRSTVDSMCRQELRKRGIDPDENIAAARRLLCTFAWQLHLGGRHPTDIPTVQHRLEEEAKLPRGFSVIPLFYSVSNYRATPIHLQFEEYFWAEEAIALMSAPESTGELYKNPSMLSSEANRMIADLIAIEPYEKRKILLDNLKLHYTRTTDHSRKLVILYMMPRLVMTEPELLRHLCSFMQKRLRHHLRRKAYLECIAILNWLSQLEDYTAEQRYFRLMTSIPDFDLLNRGVYLVYHQDVKETYGYFDRDRCEWNRTADRFREHFNSSENRQKFIRPIDMTVIRSFIEDRGSVPPPILETYGSVSEDELVQRTLYAPVGNGSSTQTYLQYLISHGKLTAKTAVAFERHLRETYRALRASIDAHRPVDKGLLALSGIQQSGS